MGNAGKIKGVLEWAASSLAAHRGDPLEGCYRWRQGTEPAIDPRLARALRKGARQVVEVLVKTMNLKVDVAREITVTLVPTASGGVRAEILPESPTGAVRKPCHRAPHVSFTAFPASATPERVQGAMRHELTHYYLAQITGQDDHLFHANRDLALGEWIALAMEWGGWPGRDQQEPAARWEDGGDLPPPFGEHAEIWASTPTRTLVEGKLPHVPLGQRPEAWFGEPLAAWLARHPDTFDQEKALKFVLGRQILESLARRERLYPGSTAGLLVDLTHAWIAARKDRSLPYPHVRPGAFDPVPLGDWAQLDLTRRLPACRLLAVAAIGWQALDNVARAAQDGADPQVHVVIDPLYPQLVFSGRAQAPPRGVTASRYRVYAHLQALAGSGPAPAHPIGNTPPSSADLLRDCGEPGDRLETGVLWARLLVRLLALGTWKHEEEERRAILHRDRQGTIVLVVDPRGRKSLVWRAWEDAAAVLALLLTHLTRDRRGGTWVPELTTVESWGDAARRARVEAGKHRSLLLVSPEAMTTEDLFRVRRLAAECPVRCALFTQIGVEPYDRFRLPVAQPGDQERDYLKKQDHPGRPLDPRYREATWRRDSDDGARKLAEVARHAPGRSLPWDPADPSCQARIRALVGYIDTDTEDGGLKSPLSHLLSVQRLGVTERLIPA